MSNNYCDQCRHYLETTERGVGRCFYLEGEAAEGIVSYAVTTDCNIRVTRNGNQEACGEFQSTVPDDLMQYIIDNDREEQRWNP